MLESQLLDEITSRLVNGVHPLAIYLFGSAVDSKSYDPSRSDIDLLLIQETTLPYRQRYAQARSCLRKMKIPFDVLVYTPKEIQFLMKDNMSVVSQALSKGVKVYGE